MVRVASFIPSIFVLLVFSPVAVTADQPWEGADGCLFIYRHLRSTVSFSHYFRETK